MTTPTLKPFGLYPRPFSDDSIDNLQFCGDARGTFKTSFPRTSWKNSWDELKFRTVSFLWSSSRFYAMLIAIMLHAQGMRLHPQAILRLANNAWHTPVETIITTADRKLFAAAMSGKSTRRRHRTML
jgi:hypothetical protein